MGVDPLALLRMFAEFAGLLPELVDLFSKEHPELVVPPGGPPEAPADGVDQDLLDAVRRGEL